MRTILLLFLTLLPPSALIASEGKGDAPAGSPDPVARAIDSIRGVKLDGLSGDEKEALGNRLDDAWKTLLENLKTAKPAIRKVLQEERDDSFLIIDLSRLLLAMEEGDRSTLEEIVAPLSRSDPNTYGRGYFELASHMAATHCKACLPAVLKMMELREIEAYIEDHALPVGRYLGLLFTVVQYDDATLEPSQQGLSSENCAVRANAVMVFGLLLPETYPASIRRMAMQDDCPLARRAAWEALDWLDDPARGGLVTERLTAQPAPDVEERQAMVSSLAGGFSESLMAPLETLAADSDPNVATYAKRALEGVKRSVSLMGQLKATRDEARRPKERKARSAVSAAARTGRFDGFDGKTTDLALALTPDDVPLLKRARLAVLKRLSDECLYEYNSLTNAAMALRHLARISDSPVGPP